MHFIRTIVVATSFATADVAGSDLVGSKIVRWAKNQLMYRAWGSIARASIWHAGIGRRMCGYCSHRVRCRRYSGCCCRRYSGCCCRRYSGITLTGLGPVSPQCLPARERNTTILASKLVHCYLLCHLWSDIALKKKNTSRLHPGVAFKTKNLRVSYTPGWVSRSLKFKHVGSLCASFALFDTPGFQGTGRMGIHKPV